MALGCGCVITEMKHCATQLCNQTHMATSTQTHTHTQKRFQINVWNEHDNLFWRAYSFRPFVYKQTHKHTHIQTYAHTYVCKYMQHLLEIVRNSIRAETCEQAYCQGVNGWQVLSGGGILQTQAKFSTFGIHTVTTITTTTSKNKNFKKLQQAQRIHGCLFRVAGSLVAFGKLLLKLVSFRGIFFRIMPLAPQALWKCFYSIWHEIADNYAIIY